tara:strand:+ start:441 stop:647 length:207 start_codon:yes stop_codon:yes gene_type:complete
MSWRVYESLHYYHSGERIGFYGRDRVYDSEAEAQKEADSLNGFPAPLDDEWATVSRFSVVYEGVSHEQ